MFVTEGHAFPLAIKLQHLDLNRVADFEQLVRILKPSPRHVGHVQQTINAAEIHKRAVIGEVLDLAFNNDVLFDLLERLILAASVLLFDHSLTRQNYIGALPIELDDFGFDCLVAQTVEISHRPYVNLRARQKRGDAVDIDAQAALDAIDDAPFDAAAFAIGLLQVVPRLHAHGVGARKHR